MGILDKLFSKEPTREEFVKKMLEELTKRGATDIQYNSEARSLQFGSRKTIFYLDNAFTDYRAAPAKGREGVIQHYASSFLQTPPAPMDFATVKSSLLPVVKDPSYFSMSRLLVQSDGKDISKMDFATKPIAPGLVAAVAQDTEHNIMNVGSGVLKGWGATFDEALQSAILNLRDKTNPNGIREIGEGFFISQWGDCYDCARILLPDVLHRLSLNGDPLVFLPNRDQLLVTGKYNSAAIRVMLTQGKASHFERGHALSPNLYVHTEGQWQQYIPEDEQLHKLWLSIRRQRDNLDYSQQKIYLEKLFQLQKKDVFVATCQLYKRKDESLFSRCVWTKGVDSFLPEADSIAFVADVKTKDVFSVAWKDALPVVLPLMERDPDLVPARYRVRAFPDESQLRQLRQLTQ